MVRQAEMTHNRSRGSVYAQPWAYAAGQDGISRIDILVLRGSTVYIVYVVTAGCRSVALTTNSELVIGAGGLAAAMKWNCATGVHSLALNGSRDRVIPRKAWQSQGSSSTGVHFSKQRDQWGQIIQQARCSLCKCTCSARASAC
jgi:hypothetical protein